MMKNYTAISTGGWCSNCGEFVYGDISHICPTVFGMPGLRITVLPIIGDRKRMALDEAMLSFREILTKHQIDTPFEFVKLVDKYFWELV